MRWRDAWHAGRAGHRGQGGRLGKDPAKDKAATTQSHRFARHQFLNAGNGGGTGRLAHTIA